MLEGRAGFTSLYTTSLWIRMKAEKEAGVYRALLLSC